MPNFFDQFDQATQPAAPAQPAGNFFDQFDQPSQPPGGTSPDVATQQTPSQAATGGPPAPTPQPQPELTPEQAEKPQFFQDRGPRFPRESAFAAGNVAKQEAEDAARKLAVSRAAAKIDNPRAGEGEVANIDWDSPLTNFWLRADMARSYRAKDKIAKLKEALPGGDVEVVPFQDGTNQGEVMLWRAGPGEPWKPVDPETLDLTVEVADVLGGSLNEVGFASTLASFVTLPVGVARTAIWTLLGPALGTYAKHYAEKYRGYEQDRGLMSGEGSVRNEAGMEAVAGVAGDKVMKLVGRLVGAPVGSPDYVPNKRELIELADSIGAPLTLAQTADSQLARAITMQASGMSPTNHLAQKIQAQRHAFLRAPSGALDDALGEASGGAKLPPGAIMSGRTTAAVTDALDMNSLVKKQTLTPVEFGQYMDGLMQAYMHRSKHTVGRLYDGADAAAKAAGEDGIRFDPERMFKLSQRANEISMGRIGAGADLNISTREGLEDALAQFDQRDTKRYPLNFFVEEEQQLVNFAKNLAALDPSLPPGAVPGQASAYELLKDLRHRLWFLAQPSTAGERRNIAENEARELHKLVTEVMENPVNDSTGFKALWKRANAENRKLEETLEHRWVEGTLRASIKDPDAMARFAATAADPKHPHTLELVDKVISSIPGKSGQAQARAQMREGIRGFILRNDNPLDFFDAYERQGSIGQLRRFFSTEELVNLRGLAANAQRLNHPDFERMVVKEFNQQKAMREYFFKADPDEISTALKNLPAKEREEFKASLRAGALSSIMDDVYEFETGTGKKLVKELSTKFAALFADPATATKARMIFDKDEMFNKFHNLGALAAMMEGKMDVGGALARGQTVSEIYRVHDPGRIVNAAAKIFNSATLSRFAAMPAPKWLAPNNIPYDQLTAYNENNVRRFGMFLGHVIASYERTDDIKIGEPQ